MFSFADSTPAPEPGEEPLATVLGDLGGTALIIATIILVASFLHLLTARIISRAVKRWIVSGRSREDSIVDNPEQTVGDAMVSLLEQINTGIGDTTTGLLGAAMSLDTAASLLESGMGQPQTVYSAPITIETDGDTYDFNLVINTKEVDPKKLAKNVRAEIEAFMRTSTGRKIIQEISQGK